MHHHPIFARFKGYSGPRPAGVHMDFIGFKIKPEWCAWSEAAAADHCEPPLPGFDDEYFEWVDLLEAVADAQGSFTMLELGAGFGRWGIRGALAAKQRGLAVRVGFVEAEPQHAAWLREALQINDVEGEVVEAAISYNGKPVPFAVKAEGSDAQNWYGQQIVIDGLAETTDTYWGKTVYRGDYYDQILVPSLKLEDIAQDLETIDFIDSDTQGAEKDMVIGSIDFLTDRVKRIHIGTHGKDIEEALREVFLSAGWRNIWDFSIGGVRETPYGRFAFGDGVQGWINPRLSDS